MTKQTAETPPVLAGWSSVERSGSPRVSAALLVVALAMVITHLGQTLFFYLPSGQFKNLHLGFALVVVFGTLAEALPPTRRWQRAIWLAVIPLALIPVVYIHLQYDALVSERTFGPNGNDLVMGSALVVVSLLAAWKKWGATIPLIGALGLLYGYFGNLMPGGVLQHSGIGFDRLVAYASIPYFQGLLGSLTRLSGGAIFAFMVFAGLLKSTGGIDFITGMARALGGRSRAGPAQVGVLSSGFMGMISGSTVANVASTGSITIPMMKRTGFPGAFAAAVEAVASTGGQITPPVMGLTAFLIVGVTGIPYVNIVLAAIFPAVIYYGFLISAVHLQAAKVGLQAQDASGGVRASWIAQRYGHLLGGVALLIYLLLIRMPPAYAATYAIAAVIVLETVRTVWVYRSAPLQGLAVATKTVVRGLDDGARNGAALGIIIAVIGVFVDILVVTGFAQKLSHLMLQMADGNLILLLILAAIACLAFGLGMPTPAAYVLVALLGAPALVQLGVDLLAAHMFVFYFATVSALTPPVALASLIAARIADADYFRVSITAVRLGMPGFLLPFLFVFRPELLLLQGGLIQQVTAAFLSLLGIVALNAALVGFLFAPLGIVARVVLAAAGICTVIPGTLSSAVGIAGVAAAVVFELAWRQRYRRDHSDATVNAPSQQRLRGSYRGTGRH